MAVKQTGKRGTAEGEPAAKRARDDASTSSAASVEQPEPPQPEIIPGLSWRKSPSLRPPGRAHNINHYSVGRTPYKKGSVSGLYPQPADALGQWERVGDNLVPSDSEDNRIPVPVGLDRKGGWVHRLPTLADYRWLESVRLQAVEEVKKNGGHRDSVLRTRIVDLSTWHKSAWVCRYNSCRTEEERQQVRAAFRARKDDDRKNVASLRARGGFTGEPRGRKPKGGRAATTARARKLAKKSMKVSRALRRWCCANYNYGRGVFRSPMPRRDRRSPMSSHVRATWSIPPPPGQRRRRRS
jgi:hypothetical protein